MGHRTKTIIVIPCYNEAGRLEGDAFAKYAQTHPETSFLFVDDGSNDNTADVLRTLCAKNPGQLVMLQNGRNMGKAYSVREGFLHGFRKQADFVGFWDADLATPLDEIDAFQTILNKQAHILAVLGSRVMLLGREIHRKHFRHYLGRSFATLVSFVLQLTIYDTQCGAKIFRNTRLVRAVFSKRFQAGWIFDVEIIARMQGLNRYADLPALEKCLVEHPLQAWRDVPGSKLKVTDFIKAVFELCLIAKNVYGPGSRRQAEMLLKGEELDHF